MDPIATLQERMKGLFPDVLGIAFTAVTPDEVKAELTVRDDLCTVPGLVHGGALMAFADTLGAVATVMNLPPSATTTTIESKTNFFRPITAGKKAFGRTTPLHKGRTTMVWETRITDDQGKLAAMTVQTQIVKTTG